MAKKQAVVVIHGMGEQRPMETLRSFVQTVWERDATLGDKKAVMNEADNSAPGGQKTAHSKSSFGKDLIRLNEVAKERTKHRPDEFAGNAWWVKPDNRTGMKELRRVTTGGINPSRSFEGEDAEETEIRRTDFFEFYWADLIQDTTLNQLLSWVQNLLLRSPRQVPVDAFAIWISLWLIILAAMAYLLSTTFEVFRVPLTILNSQPMHYMIVPVGDWLSVGWDALVTFFTTGIIYNIGMVVLVFSTVGIMLFEGLKLYWRGFFGSKVVQLTLVVIAPVLVLFSPVIDHFRTAIPWLSLLLVLGLFYLNIFLVRYFGDMARYVQATPGNVELRNKIGERGLKLLTELHESGDYDRIVIVAHSLGTIVAYDLVSMLWSKLGPGIRNPSSEDGREPLTAMDKYLREVLEDDSKQFSLAHYQQLQGDVCHALGQVKFERNHQSGEIIASPWLVTDLVTVGSPLSHAEFLLARDTQGLRTLVRERVLPTCPPVLESYQPGHTGQAGSLTIPSIMFKSGKDDNTFAHHACCFAAVRWTNIYDKPPLHSFLLGDPLSGSVLGNFGSSVRVVGPRDHQHVLWREQQDYKGAPQNVGIRDIKVAIRDRSGYLPQRWFTHNKYWKLPPSLSAPPPSYIVALRKAVNLANDPKVDWSEFDEPPPKT